MSDEVKNINEERPENIKEKTNKELTDADIDKKIEKVIEKSLLSRYIECPKCLDLIRISNGVCKRCNLRYKNGKWSEINEEEDWLWK